MKKLPIGIQSLDKLLEENFLYVDKTQHLVDIVKTGGYFFLSRPRRFGKSLLISTLKEIFLGNRALFQGLAIYDNIEWKAYPVVHLDFSMIPHDSEDRLIRGLTLFLQQTAERHQIELAAKDYDAAFAELLRKFAEKYQENVVVLIDEYDKPIIDLIENLDAAQKNRNILKNFYEILKGSDPYLRFVFLTGVSKFSKISVFSGLNNLYDITLSPQFATITGYTQAELEQYFDEHIQRFCSAEHIARDALLERIREWYNGYSWNAVDRVYNPFSILRLFADNRFRNYWFATGTPTFLIQLLQQQKIEISELEQKRISEILFDSYDIDKLDVLALLFQTGYLTISQIEQKRGVAQYTLNYPNLEVKEALLSHLFERFSKHQLGNVQIAMEDLRESLQKEDIEGFMKIIRTLFAKIPYPLHLPYEAYYHSLFYMICALMGVEIELEVLTDKGRIDGVLECDDKIYVIEFKYGAAGSDMNELTDKAIRQIHDKKYAERFANDSRKRLLLGVGFVEKTIGYQLVTADKP